MVDIELLRQTYKNKKVFLTGHTGFKGSWLLAWLKSMGAIVKGYSLPAENNFDLYNTINGSDLCQSVIADICDKNRLKKEILEFQPDYIFHLAAQPLVRLSYKNPIETYEVNTLGTANLLNALLFLNKPCSTILITTDKVYENKETINPYTETDRLGGYDPYSASKAAAELIISSYRNSFFNITKYDTHYKTISSARAGNVIGGGDWAKDRIIPDIIRALKKNERIIIRNPKSIRPWQHVLEPLYGYLLLGAMMSNNPLKYSGAWNFGPISNDTLNVEELVKLCIKHWKCGDYIIKNLEAQPHEAGLLTLDINKSINELGWKPKLTAEKSIELAINSYKNDVITLTNIENEINYYENLI